MVSKGILEALGQNGKIGDTITVPYQILKDDGLDYTKEKDFRICGFSRIMRKRQRTKTIYIIGFRGLSESGDTGRTGEISVLLQVNGQKGNTTADYTETIQNIARQFRISEG